MRFSLSAGLHLRSSWGWVTLSALLCTSGCVDVETGFSQPPAREGVDGRALDVDPTAEVLPPSDDVHGDLPTRPAAPDVGEPDVGEPDVGPEGEPEPQSACTSLDLVPVPQEALRLSDQQFANTVQALFSYGVTLDPELDSTLIVAETFTTFPGVNEVLFEDMQDLVAMSEGLAITAIDNIDQLLPCDPNVDGEVPCAEAFVATFGERAFRRPLTSAEQAAFMTLFDNVRNDVDEALTFNESIGVVVQAFLLSPQLMYLVEQGTPVDGTPDVVALTSWELASRLSYLLWNMPPDDALRAAAADGSLLDDAVLHTHAVRLMDDPRSTVATVNFVQEWFGVAGAFFNDRVDNTLAHAFNEEFALNVEHLLQNGGDVEDLLSFDETYVNAALADHYGIVPNPSVDDDDWVRTPLPSDRSGGLLTTAVFAAATAHASNHTSFIHRGKVVRERLLCGELGTPDPTFLGQDPMLPDDATVRQKLDARMEMSPCGDCHILMDPIGIGMEDLDEQGRFRSVYNNGHDVDVTGEVLFISGLDPAFHGTNELAAKLAPSEVFADCAADQWLRYVVGRRHLDNLDCLVERLHIRQAELGGDLRAMMLAAISSDAFRHRQVQGGE